MKIVDRTSLKPEDEAGLKQEVEIMQKLNHPHIVRLIDFFAEDKKYFLVIELMEGGELFDRIVKRKVYNEKQARDVVKILVDAIKYCHDNDVVHRDLKPENLLLTSPNDDADLKIADFGFAVSDNGSQNMLKTQCGTPNYIAPEILRGERYGTLNAIPCNFNYKGSYDRDMILIKNPKEHVRVYLSEFMYKIMSLSLFFVGCILFQLHVTFF